MQINRSDLADCAYFIAIARHRSFRRAGLELGVSSSALSHALKAFETRLGLRLLNRTNRSVTLTAAGEQLLQAISDPVNVIGDAFETLNRFRDAPAGRIRINMMADAAALLVSPILPVFMERYPDVELEISVDNHIVDVIDSGFDAGIRYGGTVPEDMIAQRLSGEIDWVIVGAPSYFERFGRPQHPNDLAEHRCLRIRLGDDSIYKWELDKADESVAIDVPGMITVNNADAALPAVLAGAGLTYLSEPLVSLWSRRGNLRSRCRIGHRPGQRSTCIIHRAGTCRRVCGCWSI
ncbi:LysR family transcriptional regulator [Sphingobium sp. DN12]|uniref:LysR family transcriptional regulator n=1 Tax=Sphingobium sp. DN12 TaxID=3378073 RepID=UPI003DA53EA3